MIVEAIKRFRKPEVIESDLVIWLSLLGIFANGFSVLLLKNDANITYIDRNAEDAIYYATIIRNLEIIELIAPKVKDFNKKYGGYTVLEYASKMKVTKVYDLLKRFATINK